MRNPMRPLLTNVFVALATAWQHFVAFLRQLREVLEALMILAVAIALILHVLHALGFPVPDILPYLVPPQLPSGPIS